VITTDPHEFASALPQRGRLLGLDVGTKTIGTALCDANWTIASPATLITRTKFTADRAAIQKIIESQNVKGIVIGLPLNLDGTDSPRTQSVRAFARNLVLCEVCQLLWDERWSTAAVERQMIAADITRAKRAAQVDNAAAAYILQGAIDRLASAA
jgi:putative holliday junction resolvase